MTTLTKQERQYCSRPGCSNWLMHPDSLETGKCLYCQGTMNRYYHIDGEQGGAYWPSQSEVAYVEREYVDASHYA